MKRPEWLRKYLELLRDVIPKGKGFLVGGVVRNKFLGRDVGKDIDLAVDGSGIGIAREVADLGDGFFVPMDEEMDVGRAIFEDELVGKVTVDISALRGPSIEEDLSMRDFTINAIGEELWDEEKIIDPLGGIEDLRAGILRACYERAFLEDPVRIPRAFRFHAELGFDIEDRTTALISESIPLLSKGSRERIRDELFKMLSCDGASDGVRLAQDMGALEAISGYEGVREGAWKRVKAVQEIVGSIPDEARQLLEIQLSEGRTRRSLLLLSSIPGGSPIIPNLPLSRAEVRELMSYSRGMSIIGKLWGRASLEELAFEVFWELKEAGIGTFLLWGALSGKEEEARWMVGWYLERMRGLKPRLEKEEIGLAKGEEIRRILKGKMKKLVIGDGN